MTDGVEHDPGARRFALSVGAETAYLQYVMRAADTMDATRTYTPPSARGRGVASRLVRAGLDHARAQGWRVVPTCWYVEGWMDRHPEYADLRAR